jgi:glucose-6-phosphate isomerase
VDIKGNGPTLPKARANALGLKYLEAKTLDNQLDEKSRATAQALFKNARSVAQNHLSKVNEFHVGAMMMNFMLGTIIMGKLVEVDPIDQPGVEESKVLTRQYRAER